MLLLALPAVAAAQDGVVIDDDSPTGKEYAIPVERAREEASGRKGSPSPPAPGEAAPLFGVGVGEEPDSGGGRAEPGGTRPDRQAAGSGSGGGDARGNGSSGDATRTRTAPTPVRAQVATPAGGTREALLVAGSAGLVITLGAVAGTSLRRRLRRP